MGPGPRPAEHHPEVRDAAARRRDRQRGRLPRPPGRTAADARRWRPGCSVIRLPSRIPEDLVRGCHVTGPDPAWSLVLTRLPGRATAPDAAQVMRLFPPRPAASGWPATRQSREHILTRLLAPPFTLDNPAGQAQRRRGLTRMLDWLGSLPGQTWQDRWIISGAGDCSPWRQLPDRCLADDVGGSRSRGMYFYQLLRGTGVFPAGARPPPGCSSPKGS